MLSPFCPGHSNANPEGCHSNGLVEKGAIQMDWSKKFSTGEIIGTAKKNSVAEYGTGEK
jgi:hypothetical protein